MSGSPPNNTNMPVRSAQARSMQTPFEELIADSLGPETLPDFSPDQVFLGSLNRRINGLPSPVSKTNRPWFSGICQGAAAASFGLILFTALNVLPPLLVNTSVTGAIFAREKAIAVTFRGRALWQQLVVNFENQTRSLTNFYK